MRRTVEEKKTGVKFLYNFRRALYGYGRIQAGSVLRTQPLSVAAVRPGSNGGGSKSNRKSQGRCVYRGVRKCREGNDGRMGGENIITDGLD